MFTVRLLSVEEVKSTVCAAVVASKNPDGYSLGVISSSATAIRNPEPRATK